GQKIPLYREELATAAASRLLGRPVRWIETRRENLLAALHAREDIVDVRAAAKSDGTLLGLDVKILTDFGAYAYFPANYMARVIGMMVPGAYRLRDYRYAITAVLTNKCPAGPYRAPMLICSWVTEGTIDAIARALELDPIEVRRQNMLTESDLPYTTAGGMIYRSVYPRDTLERALAAFDYKNRRQEQAGARAAGRIAGIGAAVGATRVLKQKLLRIAAHLLEAPLEDLELVDGSIRVRGAPTSGMTIAQLAQKAYLAPTELPPGMEPGLEATHAFDPPPLTFSSGTHICEVEIDPEVGAVALGRYTIVEDCGRLLNPRVVEGQLPGATAQGLAGALFEEA